MLLKCEQCNKDFNWKLKRRPFKRDDRRSRDFYCSDECWESRPTFFKERKNKSDFIRREIKCPGCNQMFLNSQLNKHYCSKACELMFKRALKAQGQRICVDCRAIYSRLTGPKGHAGAFRCHDCIGI